MKKNLLLLFLSFALILSCKQSRNSNCIKDLDSLKTEFNTLNDSLTSTWKVMMESDSAKLGNIKRLLQEVSYTKVHNKPLLDSLMQMRMELSEQRYTMETMTSDKIDNYDAATEALLNRLPQLASSVPDLERYPLYSELSQEIDAANQAVLLHRIHYDKYARQYNEMIQKYGKELAGAGYTDLKPKLLFQLGT
jgi:hypothetical protein